MIPIKDIRIKSSGVIHPATLLKADGAIKGIKAIKRGGTVHEVDDEWLPIFTIEEKAIVGTPYFTILLHDAADTNRKVYIDLGIGTGEIDAKNRINTAGYIPTGFTGKACTISLKGDLTNIKRIGGTNIPIKYYWNQTLQKMLNLESIFVYADYGSATHNYLDLSRISQLNELYIRKPVSTLDCIQGLNTQLNLKTFVLRGYANTSTLINNVNYYQDITKLFSSTNLTTIYNDANYIIDLDLVTTTTISSLELGVNYGSNIIGDIGKVISDSNSTLITAKFTDCANIYGNIDSNKDYHSLTWFYPNNSVSFNLSIISNRPTANLVSFYQYSYNNNITGNIEEFKDVCSGTQYAFRSGSLLGSMTILASGAYPPRSFRHIYRLANVTGTWSDHNNLFYAGTISGFDIEHNIVTGNIEDMTGLASKNVVISTVSAGFGGTFTLHGLSVRGNFGAVIGYLNTKPRWYAFTKTSFTEQNVTDSINTLFDNRNLSKTTYVKEVTYEDSINSVITSGTYQQPSGFTHDLDEGNLTTLATSWSIAEKIWVLENMQTSTTITTKRYNWLFIYDGK